LYPNYKKTQTNSFTLLRKQLICIYFWLKRDRKKERIGRSGCVVSGGVRQREGGRESGAHRQ